MPIVYVCWQCKHEHQQDVTVCEQCGAVNHKTIMIENDADAGKLSTFQSVGSQESDADKLMFINELALQIGDEQLVVPINKRVIFGRDIPTNHEYNGIDLTRFKAHEMGVSRRHADLRRVTANRLILIDLGSTNGTHINGKHLTPFKAYALKHNDQLKFGRLSLSIQLIGMSLPVANSV